MDTTSTRWSLWFAFLSGPLAWTAHELLTYVLVRPSCSNGALILEYVVTFATLVVVVAGGYVALRDHQGRFAETQSTPQFLTVAAVVLNVLFGYAILMETIPNVLVSPCL